MGLFNKMSKKRRNNGRAKKNKGRSNLVVCLNRHRMVGKDKSVKRFQMRNIVDGSSRKDIEDNSAYPKGDSKTTFHLPKLYLKQSYCVSCAIHARIVRVRSQTRGDRDTRYTTKLRRFVEDEARTGGFAVPAPNFIKPQRTNNQGGN